YDLEQLGIANNDTTLTAYIHEGIERSSPRRPENAVGLEQALVDSFARLRHSRCHAQEIHEGTSAR
ncbi:MAG: hypothetical protein OXG11_06850, partial [Chloroflexi bacterium]|nr:hypothetical protein [Chloroflexota bacterium]